MWMRPSRQASEMLSSASQLYQSALPVSSASQLCQSARSVSSASQLCQSARPGSSAGFEGCAEVPLVKRYHTGSHTADG
eukprot:358817-Chlamydomonas_euryale.AAC.4